MQPLVTMIVINFNRKCADGIAILADFNWNIIRFFFIVLF